MSGVVYLVSHPGAGGDVLLRVLEAAQRYVAHHADLAIPAAPGSSALFDLHRSFKDLQAAVQAMNRRFSDDDNQTVLRTLAAGNDREAAFATARQARSP